MPTDLTPRWMLVKAALFVVLAVLAGGFLLWQVPTWTTAACVLALVWASSRAYFFTFHVVQHWIDPGARCAGLLDFVRRWRRRRIS